MSDDTQSKGAKRVLSLVQSDALVDDVQPVIF